MTQRQKKKKKRRVPDIHGVTQKKSDPVERLLSRVDTKQGEKKSLKCKKKPKTGESMRAILERFHLAIDPWGGGREGVEWYKGEVGCERRDREGDHQRG